MQNDKSLGYLSDQAVTEYTIENDNGVKLSGSVGALPS